MGTFLRAQVTIPTTSGLSANQVVWTLHFVHPDVSANRNTDATEIQARVAALLNSLAPQTLNSTYCFGSSMICNAAVLNVFDLNEEKPRVPFLTHTFTSNNNPMTGGQDLPPEVALCISYQAPRVSGQAQNRRRGRIYIGPLQFLNNAAVDHLVPGQGGVDDLLQKVKSALQPGTAGATQFGILSRQTWAGLAKGEKPPPDPNTGEIVYPEIPLNLNDALVPVTSWWCDNAWDTQRRRGVKSTYRKTL